MGNPTPPPGDAFQLLQEVEDDVAQHVLALLNAYEVTRLALTSSTWRDHVRRFRRKLVCIEYTPTPPHILAQRTHASSCTYKSEVDSTWVFATLGSEEAPLRVPGAIQRWRANPERSEPVPSDSEFPDDDEWIDDAYDELPDDSWLALAKAHPGHPLCLACVPRHLAERVAPLFYAPELPLWYGPEFRHHDEDRRNRFPETEEELDALVDYIQPFLGNGAMLSLKVDEVLRLHSDGFGDVDNESDYDDDIDDERFEGENRACIDAFYERLREEGALRRLSELQIRAGNHYPSQSLPFCGTIEMPRLAVLQVEHRQSVPVHFDWRAAFSQLTSLYVYNCSTSGAFEHTPIASILNAKVHLNLCCLHIGDVDESIVDVEFTRVCPNLKNLALEKPFSENPSNGDDLLRRLAHNLFYQDTGEFMLKDEYNCFPRFYGDYAYGDDAHWRERFHQLRPRATAVPDAAVDEAMSAPVRVGGGNT